jgi:hypothetical protein
MTLEELKSEKKRLNEELFEIEHQIYKIEKRTADGHPIVLGEPYYYKNGFDNFIPVVFPKDAKFWQEVIWVKHDEHMSSGSYYRNIYKNKPPEEPKRRFRWLSWLD